MEVLTYCARSRSGVVPDGISDVLKHVTEPFLERCKNIGLLDVKRGVISVHDWETYNPKDRTAAERMARMRDRNKPVTGTVTLHAPVPSHESKDSVRPDVSKVCQDCGETIGHGHLEDCPRMPKLALAEETA